MQDGYPALASNIPEYSVGEISQQVKRTVEGAFNRVRVRGEVSRPSRAASGHLYLTLKDESAVLDGVCWRHAAARLAVRPEEGMEVICTGRLTTYPGRSKYQLVIEQVELAGEGALLKLLEERRRRLLAEGLFDAARKRPLPFLPAVIGVVTSPTGAVIRDILHRLADRFPVHVLVWPVPVQGDGAADRIARAIADFNALGGEVGPLPRPDLLIVARGGGSLEDLWAFNEEAVVRAAAASAIPLISAVGHETDTTLIDFASDRRAPTPSAAAEMAVPVRAELRVRLSDGAARLANAVNRRQAEAEIRLDGLARGLGDPRALIETRAQTVDYRGDALAAALDRRLDRARLGLAALADRLPDPKLDLVRMAGRFDLARTGLDRAADRGLADRGAEAAALAGRLRPEPLVRALLQGGREAARLDRRLDAGAQRRLADLSGRLDGLARLLRNSSLQRTLERGFVLALDRAGRPVTEAAATRPGQPLDLRFHDGTRQAVIAGPGAAAPARRRPRGHRGQDSLF